MTSDSPGQEGIGPDPSRQVGSHSRGRPLFWVVVGLIILYLALDVVAQLLPPHYSPISQAESDLAVGPFGYVMTINFLNRGVLSLLFLFAFLGAVRLAGESGRQYRTGALLLGVWGVGALLLAVFPTDVPSTPVSAHGAIHLVVALVAFAGGALGELSISRALRRDPVMQALRRPANAISVLAVVMLFVELGLPVFPHLSNDIGGLTERIFLSLVLLWISVVSAHLARSPSLRQEASTAA